MLLLKIALVLALAAPLTLAVPLLLASWQATAYWAWVGWLDARTERCAMALALLWTLALVVGVLGWSR